MTLSLTHWGKKKRKRKTGKATGGLLTLEIC